MGRANRAATERNTTALRTMGACVKNFIIYLLSGNRFRLHCFARKEPLKGACSFRHRVGGPEPAAYHRFYHPLKDVRRGNGTGVKPRARHERRLHEDAADRALRRLQKEVAAHRGEPEAAGGKRYRGGVGKFYCD